MNKLSKKEINRLYGKNKKRSEIRVPKGEPYKRKNQKLDIRDLENS